MKEYQKYLDEGLISLSPGGDLITILGKGGIEADWDFKTRTIKFKYRGEYYQISLMDGEDERI